MLKEVPTAGTSSLSISVTELTRLVKGKSDQEENANVIPEEAGENIERNFCDNKTQFNVINTNRRSLRPKIAPLLQCFISLSLILAVVSETWFALGSGLDLRAEELLLGQGLRSFTLNRDPLPSGIAYSGVAIILRDSNSRANSYHFPNP